MPSPPTDAQTQWSAASLILNSPHLVDTIMKHATRATLTNCLRVRPLHDAAGRVLYHTVRIDGHNIAGFFLGALIGTGDIAGEHCFESRYQNCVREVDDGCVVYPVFVPIDPTTQRSSYNFKAPLLGRVRVLSLGSHHTCACNDYGPHVGSLFRSLDTLRVVPTAESAFSLVHLCDLNCPYGSCLLFTNLKPRKLVFRNLGNDEELICAWPFDHLKKAEYLEEIVVCSHINAVNSTALEDQDFSASKDIKIIFNCQWEEWPTRMGSRISRQRSFHSITPSFLLFHIQSWSKSSGRPLTLVGLETIPFKTEWCDLSRLFQSRFPTANLDSEGLRRLVKEELRTGRLSAEQVGVNTQDSPYKRDVVYQTLDEYAALTESDRLYELDDGLPPWLE